MILLCLDSNIYVSFATLHINHSNGAGQTQNITCTSCCKNIETEFQSLRENVSDSKFRVSDCVQGACQCVSQFLPLFSLCTSSNCSLPACCIICVESCVYRKKVNKLKHYRVKNHSQIQSNQANWPSCDFLGSSNQNIKGTYKRRCLPANHC